MPKPLVIVESVAKARTIAGYLGAGSTVESSLGHVRALPANAAQVPKELKGTDAGKLGVDVEDGFRPIYIVPPERKDVVKKLKGLLKQADELVLATDEDREGEAIAWHLLEVLKPSVPVKRMVFHEITKSAIEEALANPRELDMKLVEAQEGRRVLDRLVGYEISPVLWKKVMPRLSAGRVQSVATRLVVERERLRMAFRRGDWWDIEGEFAAHGVGFPARLVELDGRRVPTGKDFDPATGRPSAPDEVVMLDEGSAGALAERLNDGEFRVTSVETSPWRQHPAAPFITSTLQQEASRKLRYSASRTMAAAQSLYNAGYITYMRTDSTNLSQEAVTAARRQIRELFGDPYLPDQPRSYRRKVKNAQEAHEAIRPAGDRMRTPDQVRAELSGDELRLYELIWMRTIACQMEDARGQRVSLRLEVTSTSSATGTGELAVFAASGRTIDFPGFLRAYVEGSDDPDADLEERETVLPPVREGETVECTALTPSSHTTQPPARYTEASLVKELEDDGIGRPSTYATVLQTIQDRGYVWKKGNALVPSWTAFAVTQLLERHFEQLVDYRFTARMEEDLDVIASNQGESEKWLHGFYFGNGTPGLRSLVAEERLDAIDKESVNTVPIGEDAQGQPIVVRVWPNGGALHRGDQRAPIPDDIAPDELTPELIEELLARASAGPRVLGVEPESGEKVLVLTGRYGPFVQLGELEDGSVAQSKVKPPRASLFSSMEPETVTLEDALRLLALPRVVGVDAEGTEITALNGRYGPYIKKGTDSRSLETEEQLFTVTLPEAEALFAQPKRRGRGTPKPPLAELGEHPESGAAVRVLDGRYGPYVTDGTTNATVPRGKDPKSLTMTDAVDLLAERAARAPAKKARKSTRKATSKASGAKRSGTAKKAPRKRKAG